MTREDLVKELALDTDHYSLPRHIEEIAPYVMCLGHEVKIKELYPNEATYKRMEALYGGKLMQIEALEVPENISRILDRAFSHLHIRRVHIKGKITLWGEGVFSRCSKLFEVKIEEGTEYLGNCLFAVCSSLTHVRLPSTLREIGICAFQFCRSLSHIELPKELRKIHPFAFSYTALESVCIPRNTEVNSCAFFGCPLKHLVVPKGFSTKLEGVPSDLEIIYYDPS